MPKMWELGCLNCEKPKYTEQETREGCDPTIRNVYLLVEDENVASADPLDVHRKITKVIATMCQECYALRSYDLDKLRENLYASEIECAKSRAKSDEELERRMQMVDKFKDIEFIGFIKT
jgi:hypothetical protein